MKSEILDFDIRKEIKELYPSNTYTDPIVAMCNADQRFWMVDSYLEKSDKGPMSASLEVRVPFLDNHLIEFANSLPSDLRMNNKVGKRILRIAYEDLLPKDLFSTFKRGFSIPISQWLRGDLKKEFKEYIFRSDAYIREFIKVDKIKLLFDEHSNSKMDHSIILWRILLLEIWFQKFKPGY